MKTLGMAKSGPESSHPAAVEKGERTTTRVKVPARGVCASGLARGLEQKRGWQWPPAGFYCHQFSQL